MKENILILQTAFLGDAILTLPLIQAAYKKFGEPQIDVVCTPATTEIFSLSPYVRDIIVLDKKRQHKSFYQTILFGLKLRNGNYDLVISPHRSFRSSVLVLLSGAKEKVGFDTSAITFVYTKKIKYDEKKHEVARNLSLLDDGGLLIEWKILPECKLPDFKLPSELNSGGKNNFIAIAPGSVWETKKYPEEYFVKLISKFIGEHYKIVLIGGREDYELCEKLKIESSDPALVFNFAGKLKIGESISLLKKSELLICNDSAPTHMGMCADIPVLTIYCSTVPEFGFYPYNSQSAVISYDELDCKPCGIHGRKKCPIKTFDCGFKLTPEIVFEKAKTLLKKN